jgi:hypothetical protein
MKIYDLKHNKPTTISITLCVKKNLLEFLNLQNYILSSSLQK